MTRRTLATALMVALAPGILPAQEDVRARMEFDRLRLYSGEGVNLANQLQLARMQAQAMIGNAPYPTSALSRTWRPLGPDRTVDWGQHTSGRVSAIAIHPSDPNIIYIGAAQGGVWRTDDRGASWRPLTDRECSLAMGSIAIDPVDPNIIYAGTGEQHFSGDSYYGCGVLRSLDGGGSWERFGAGEFGATGNGATISRVFIDPVTAGSATSTTVFAASSHGLFRSRNSGRSWSRALAQDRPATDLVMKPGDPSRLYAGIWGTGVYRAVSGGASWEFSSAGIDDSDIQRINLAVAPSSPDVIYAAIVLDEGEHSLGLYRSDDGAQTWRRLPATGVSCHNQCWYDLTIAVHPSNPDRVYVGTVILYLSEDGGLTFNIDHPTNVYVDQHLMVFDTLSGSNVLYLANDGGVYRSEDAGASYTSLSTNLAITQFYAGISLHPFDPDIALGGTQDQGTQMSSAGTTTWEKVVGGDGGATAFDMEDPSVWYAETQWAPGQPWTGPRRNGDIVGNGIDRNEDGLFIPPLVMDPVDSRRLYFGATRLYRTDNSAESWAPMFEGSDGVITAIAPSFSEPNTVYIAVGGWTYGGGGYGPGSVFVTHDAGLTWSSNSLGLPERFFSDLAVHPTDPSRAYVVAGGFHTGHVFETVNSGRSWRDRSGNLPNMPVNAVLYDPVDPAGIYIGTDLGVYYSATGGGSWAPLSDEFPMVAVFDLAAQPGTGRLVAATHGRGTFELPIDVPLVARTRPTAIVDTLFPGRISEDSVIVAPSGRDDYRTSWSAGALGGTWLSVVTGEGVGRGRFAYRIAPPEDLPAGDYSAAITVEVVGTDPIAIPVDLNVQEWWSTMSVSRTGAHVTVPMGYATSIADSLGLTFVGSRATETAWSATRMGAGWAELVVESGTGTGAVTWTGDVSGLAVGTYVDSIVVTAPFAAGSPVTFLDTLTVEPALSIAAIQSAEGIGVAGLETAPGGSLLAGLSGFGADSAVWTATTTSPWLELDTMSGGMTDSIVWNRSAASLEPGVHVDTISVGVRNHPNLRGIIVDSFTVVEPMSIEAIVFHITGAPQLSSAQSDFLDWFGNGDGELNAGDALRWLVHCMTSESAGGCALMPGPTGPGGNARRRIGR